MSDLVERKCPICGVVYGLERDYWEFRERGGTNNGKPAGWHCPNGHALVIRDSDADKLRRERDRLQQRLAERDDELKRAQARHDTALRSRAAVQGHLTRLKKRAKAGVCVCCNRTFKNLQHHMATKHPEFDPAEDVAPLAAAE